MLYSEYTVLNVNSSLWHGEIERDNLNMCSTMMIELWTRKKEIGDEVENDVQDMGGYEKSVV
jgi:hypothetical protein